MSKKNQNVFKQISESLQKIADNLDDAVTVLYVLGTEAAEMHDELKAFLEKTSDILSHPIMATVDVEKLAEALTKKRGWET